MGQQLAASAATAGTMPAFRVLVNIDITGSMASQLEAVKDYCAKLATMCQDLGAPVSFAIITFTESSKGCYVSLDEFQDLNAARDFVRSVSLCCPPGHPDVQGASGGDGDENHKAALYHMAQLDPSIPTISFLITDAGPHFRADSRGSEAQQELRWLGDKGLAPEVAGDIQRVFGLVLEHFNGSLVQNVVFYGREPHLRSFYGSLAQRTGGMLMEPQSTNSSLLAGGLLHIVKSLLTHLVPEHGAGASAEEEADPLRGFTLFDLAQLQPVATEEEELGSVRVGDGAAIFDIAMERMVTVCGSKWSKRAKGMSAPGEQLTFVWRAARYIAMPPTDASAAATELAALLELRGNVLEQLPEQDRGHFSINEQDLRDRLRNWYQALSAAPTAGAPGVSAISLATVGDALEEEGTWEDVLADVAKLLLGYPLRVQVPLDRNGCPDFMDAWSSRLEALGCDTISSADFLRLIGDAPAAVGPTDRQEHNAFLVTASPSDPLASLMLRLASGTQVLNYVTGVCLGAPGFLPNLYPGVAAATLVSLLDQEALSGFQWRQAQELLHCLCSLHHAPARALLQALEVGRANPEDPVSKLVASAARLQARGSGAQHGTTSSSSSGESAALRGALKLVLQEWLLGMVQRAYGRRDEEGTAEYLRVIRTYLPVEQLLAVPANMDPLQQLHPLEKPAAAAAADLRAGWEAAASQRIMYGAADTNSNGSSDSSKVGPLRVVQRFERAARRLVTLLLGSPDSTSAATTGSSSGGADALLPLSSVWPEWQQAVLQALLLRWRTARYTSSQGEEAAEGGGSRSSAAAKPAAVVWTPVEVLPPTSELLLQRLGEVHADDIKAWRAARLASAEAALGAAAMKVLHQHAHDEEALNDALAQLFLQLTPDAGTPGSASSIRPADAPRGPLAVLLDVTARLERKAVPQLLQELAAAGGPTQVQLTVLLTGNWSTLPTTALKRSAEVLAAVQAAGRQDLEEALAARDKCCRTKGANRHGHAVKLQYPGPAGWSKEYAEERMSLLEGRAMERAQRYLAAMKRYTEMVAAARAAAAAGSSSQLAAVEALLLGCDDANELPRLLDKVEGVLGKALPSQLRSCLLAAEP